MKCDFCDHEANIEIVIFVNGKAQKVRMCASCYQERLSEMMDQLPEEIGGQQLTDQIRNMLEQANAGGPFFQGMEFSFHPTFDMEHQPGAADEEDMEEQAEAQEAEDDAGAEEGLVSEREIPFPPFEELFRGLGSQSRKENHEPPASARDRAFAQQRRDLKRRRRELVAKMQIALQEEDYETCALYRDELNATCDALVKLNEERKDPYGV